MRKKWIWILLSTVGVGGVAAAVLVPSDSTESVRLAVVEEGRITTKIFASGKLEAENIYSHYSDASGVVGEVLVKQGDRVKQGQTLLTFNTSELESQIREAESTLQILELEKQKLLRDQEDARNKQFEEFKKQQIETRGEGTPPTIKPANTSLEDARIFQQQAKISELKRKLEKQKLDIQGSGIVTELPVVKGQHLNQGEKTMVVTDTDKLRVRAQANELDASKLKAEMPAIIKGEAFAKPYQGKISSISPIAVLPNPTSREAAIELFLTVDNANAEELKPGFNVVAEFSLQGDPSLLLPRSAVVQDNGKSFVYQAVNGKAQKHEVKLGKEGDEFVELKEGLKAGDPYISEITPGLKEGKKVVMP